MSSVTKKNSTEPTFKESVTNYFKGVKVEWGKITWPEQRQVVVETIVVLLVVFFFVSLIFIYDKIFGFLLGLLTQVKP